MSFQEDFAKTPWGPQRERLVYQEAMSQGKPTNLVPITVNGPQNSKITYYIMRDFLKSGDGQYLTMSATTAQKLANNFHMYLPTNTVADQVWKAAKAAGSVVDVPPLSGTGYRGADGRWYTPQDVVSNRISSTDAAVEYSNRVNDALSRNQKAQNGIVDIGSGGKWLTMPPANGSIGLHGIRQGDSTVQGGYGTIHQNYEDHTEYGTYVRLLDDRVDVQAPDGRKQTMSIEDFARSPYHSAMFMDGQDVRNGELATYDVRRDKAGLPQSGAPASPGRGGQPSLEEINQFLDSIMTEVASTRSGMKKFSYFAQEDSTLNPNGIILPNQYGYQPGVPPPGYGMPDFSKDPGFKGRAPKGVEDVAKQVLHMFLADQSTHPIGTMIPFSVDGKQYMARAEVHSNSPYGISVYQSKGGNGAAGRMKFLQRLQNSPEESLEQVNEFLSELEQEL